MTGIVKDGDMLVCITRRLENGKPIWVIIALTLDGETMNMAQMLELSQTIKRGSRKKAASLKRRLLRIRASRVFYWQRSDRERRLTSAAAQPLSVGLVT